MSDAGVEGGRETRRVDERCAAVRKWPVRRRDCRDEREGVGVEEAGEGVRKGGGISKRGRGW
jgi:hypothetical protein